jgi:serine/threonine protein kinase
MQDLGTELGRFIRGSIDGQQLRSIFRAYLEEHPEERDSVSAWLRGSLEEGRLPSTIWVSLRDLFDAPTLGRPDPSPNAQASGQIAWPATAAEQVTQGAAPSVVARSERPLPQKPIGPGVVVKERFVLVELLGSGGMGQVFKARDLLREEAQDRNPYVAIKVLNSQFSAHPASFMALQRESRRASSLAHPNVVTVHDFDRDGWRIFMTMEYLEGAPLDAFLRNEWSSGLPLEKAWPVIHDISQALEYGHQKRIVHSDLKPGNIFICKEGTVKVLDFGISRIIRSADTKANDTVFDGQRIGGLTPAYASLEMWSQQTPDPRDDIYAFACVTYELLTGKHPFGHASAEDAVDRDLAPKRIEGLNRSQWESLKKGLALHRKDRTATVREFVEPFRPRTLLQRYALPGGAAAAVAVVIALSVGALYYRAAVRGSAMADVECASLPQPSIPASSSDALTEAQRGDLEGRLALATDYLADVSETTSSEELKSILTEGPNSVEYIINSVLAVDPGQPQAHAMKSKVAEAYAAKARTALAAGQTGEALDLARYARAVQPQSEDLCRFELQIREQSVNAPETSPAQ